MPQSLRFLCLCWIVSLGLACHAQDVIFNQYFAHRTFVNPAMTGYDGGVHMALSNRTQWIGLSGLETGNGATNRARFNSYMASLDVDIPCYNLATGGYIVRHELGQGYYVWQSGGASLAVSLPFGSSNNLSTTEEIRFGVTAHVSNRTLQNDDFTFSDQLNAITGFDPGLISGAPAANGDFLNDRPYGDVTAGLMYGRYKNNQNLRIGFTVHHLLRPQIGLVVDQERLPVRYSTEGMYTWDRGSRSINYTLMAKVDLQRFSGGFIHRNVQYGVGMSYPYAGNLRGTRRDAFWWGLYLQTRNGYPNWRGLTENISTNTPLIMVGIKNGRSKFSFSYGIPFSGINARSVGTFEFSFRYYIPQGLRRCCVEKDLLGDQF
ncbi:MAG: PorP/SprF family type IX secretion system membrane protein [Bacteroidota bacterium]